METSTESSADNVTSTKGISSGSNFSGGMFKRIRQIVIFILGMSVLIVGIAMIVLPGPATVVIPSGLAILATEFLWARRWLAYLKRRAQDVAEWTANSVTAKPDPEPIDDQASKPAT
jgi:hypothetical protein